MWPQSSAHSASPRKPSWVVPTDAGAFAPLSAPGGTRHTTHHFCRPLPDSLPMAYQFQPAEHLHCPFTHHSISYLAPLTTLITGEKSGTVMAERLSDWLVALRHQTPRSFRRGRKQSGESQFSQKNDVTQGPSSYPRTSQHTLSIHIPPPCAGTGSSRRDPTSGARHRTRLSCSPEGTGDPCSHPTTATREGCTWPWLVTWVPLLTCRAACETHNGEVAGLWGLQR